MGMRSEPLTPNNTIGLLNGAEDKLFVHSIIHNFSCHDLLK